jgi:hypothetical protein
LSKTQNVNTTSTAALTEDLKEINDENLKKRLQNLTSFINNLEPSTDTQISDASAPPPPPPTSEIENQSEIKTDNLKPNEENKNSNYYDMISEQAKLKLDLEAQTQASSNFNKLNHLLSDIKLKEDDQVMASAPTAPSMSSILEERIPLPILNTLNSPPLQPATIESQIGVVDFNLDKIKQLNKLNYPRLTWNKTSTTSPQIDTAANNRNSMSLTGEELVNEYLILSESIKKKNALIDEELMRFFDRDQLCKELEVYYKCKLIQSEQFDTALNDFIQTHSNLNEFQYFTGTKTSTESSSEPKISHRKHEFYELLKDYYEARQLVNKCLRHMNEFKWEYIANQMRTIWTFEKYTIESSGQCGDQQNCKHELTSEKAYLNKLELTKLQTMLFELRFNLIKSGLISSQFCSKLAKVKIDSYLHDFLVKVKKNDYKTGSQSSNISFDAVNKELRLLVDILFYFTRKHSKPSLKIIDKNKNHSKSLFTSANSNLYYEADDSVPVENVQNGNEKKDDNLNDEEENEQSDELFKINLQEWFKVIACLLLNQTEIVRSNFLLSLSNQSNGMSSSRNNIQATLNSFTQFSNLHFENVFFVLQHLLRSPEGYSNSFSYLFQVPLILNQVDLDTFYSNPHNLNGYVLNLFKSLNLNSSQSDPLVNMYFDFYLKLFASFSYDVKYRRQFLFVNSKSAFKPAVEIVNSETEGSNSITSNWQLVDLEGDLESIESVMIEISEDDLIKLYYQIPLYNIYSFLWCYLNNQAIKLPNDRTNGAKMSSNGDMMDMDSSKLASDGTEFRKRYVAMKILSFLDYLSRLSIRTLLIYNRLKYKNFCKLVGKTIKESIKFASIVCKFSSNLQSQYDHFVKRIFTTIIYSSRVKSIRWTILSQLNIGSLCLRTKWLILSIMCGIDVFHQNFEHLFNSSSSNSIDNPKAKDYVLQACQNDLETLLSQDSGTSSQESGQTLSDMELVSFMRTLHFLINLNKSSSNSKESLSLDESIFTEPEDQISFDELNKTANVKIEPSVLFNNKMFKNYANSGNEAEDEDELCEFMSCVVKVIFKIAYCYPSTRDVCHKEGNALLFAVCSSYPKLIGNVLKEIDAELNSIGKRALFLSAELPFNLYLAHMDCESDLVFLQKCLLLSPTNSVLFRLAVNFVDNLDFKQDTKQISKQYLRNWLIKNRNNPNCGNLSDYLHKENVDLAQIVKIKLAIVLFELHSRLTIYNYFTKTNASTNPTQAQLSASTTNLFAPTTSEPNLENNNSPQNSNTTQLFNSDYSKDSVNVNPILTLNITSKDELNTHYSRLPKDKRLAVVNWIWSTLHRMTLFLPIDQSQFIDYLEELSIIYSSSSSKLSDFSSTQFLTAQRYLHGFYQTYLSQQTNQHQLVEMSYMIQQQTQNQEANSSNNQALAPLQTILQPKCPLECYLRLVFSRSGHDLNYLFEHGLELVQAVLTTHKKQTQSQQIAYHMVFDWFENIIYKHSTVRIKLNSKASTDSYHQYHANNESDVEHSLLAQFRSMKQANLNKLSTLLLIVFNPSANTTTSSSIIDMYCTQIYKRIEKLNSYLNSSHKLQLTHLQQQQLDENLQNYLYLWIEILITSIKNWHKYKNIVKLLDFLIAYSFQSQNKKKTNQNNDLAALSSFDSIINMNLLDELMSYVKIDFGVVPNATANSAELANLSTSQQAQQGQPSNWTLNWIANSFSYVVSTTATQLSGTVGAALNAVNGMNGSNSNGDFETNHQQFTYDKRLYKECPYVGFYLSLCEERIEAQLSIWTTFRSFLFGANDSLEARPVSSSAASNANWTPSFIESCWRKTLNSINKMHNVSLNFTPQRLMLFKWCERAIDLPVDHPLLILYWQKFFNIYLDKDYYSSFAFSSTTVNSPSRSNRNPFDLELTPTQNSNPGNEDSPSGANQRSAIQSPTFKLFTSSTQLNSLLKQMKKQLEMTSEHYAYQCTDKNKSHSDAGSNLLQPTAPVSNYHFNEFMSKLYYALSLWIDETRLHDPNLYLPALPAHYEPNLLAKIFSKQCDFWVQYVDMNKLNYHLTLIVHPHLKNESTSKNELIAARKNTFDSSSTNADLFFKQVDRLVVGLPTLSQLNMKFTNALKEKFGDAIESLLQIEPSRSETNQHTRKHKNEAELILNICEHELKNIFRYNKEVINHTLNNMLKLDDKLTNKLLVHLWNNEMCEKYVQVPCTSLINPMHQCTRPAMVKFVYEVATKRDQFRHEIKENRLNHDKLIANLIENHKVTNEANGELIFFIIKFLSSFSWIKLKF